MANGTTGIAAFNEFYTSSDPSLATHRPSLSFHMRDVGAQTRPDALRGGRDRVRVGRVGGGVGGVAPPGAWVWLQNKTYPCTECCLQG
jgi:hypothetical protein